MMKTRILTPLAVLATTTSILAAQTGSGETSTRNPNDPSVLPPPHAAEGYLPYGEQGSPVVVPRAADDDDRMKAREVISELLASHHKAIELSRIAESTTTDTEIRAFAEATTATNTAAREDLDNLMKSMGPVAKAPPGNTYDEREWRMKDAAEFNEDYVDTMVDVHQELVDLLETAGESEHPDLEAHARSSITGIKLHLERAKLLEEARD